MDKQRVIDNLGVIRLYCDKVEAELNKPEKTYVAQEPQTMTNKVYFEWIMVYLFSILQYAGIMLAFYGLYRLFE